MKIAASTTRTHRLRSHLSAGLVALVTLGIALPAASQQPAGAPPASSGAASTTATTPPAPTTYTAPAAVTQPQAKKSAPPPKAPSDEQIAALERMAKDVKDYEKDARDFRDAITTVVKHHYEARRRRVLSGLDREIATEREGLKKARDEAIERLEAFIARYGGPASHPEHTPAAMFRLAALYEERARQEMPNDQLPEGLKPAIALYKRVVTEFPKYGERAAIFYYLGHALNDAGRQPEAQQWWRALVCANHFGVPQPDPTDAARDLIAKKPQDHSEKWWDAWYGMHTDPIDVEEKKGKRRPAARPAPRPAAKGAKKADDAKPTAADEEPATSEDELSYRPIYLESCAPIPQKIEPGKETRYVAEVWWQIGDFHFELLDTKGGPYNYNRAVTAYRLAMSKVQDRYKNPIYGVSMYKLAWTYFKQQRYEAAVREFVTLLEHTDEMEKKTGDPGADFRKEAYDYVAGSLTYVDFVGPREQDPMIVRSDVIDTETREGVAEQKMRIGIDRASDPKLIPQDRKWTVEIFKALSREYREVNQLANVTETLETILKKWPCYREAPLIQDELAATYEERARFAATKSQAAADELQTKALQARTNLAKYVGNTEWVECNKDDPEAIQMAEKLVKGGLRQAAVQHTLKAREYMQLGNQSTDTGERRDKFDKALQEFRLAEQGWTGYLNRDPNATDAYESRYWIADALYWQVALLFTLEQPIQPELTGRARQANADVRDSNEDDRFLEPTALNIVGLTDFKVKEQYRKAERGEGGYPEQKQLEKNGNDVVERPIQPEVLATVSARDEYIARVSPALDPFKNGEKFEYQAAEIFFLYGQFPEAEKRLTAVYTNQCKKSVYAVQAWQKLLTMLAIKADKSGTSEDLAKVRDFSLREQNPETKCSMSDAAACDPKKDPTCIDPTLLDIEIAYKVAAEAYEKAKTMQDGPERAAQWRRAAEAYGAALQKNPKHPKSPEAAINGAIAWKNIGEYDKAIEMYNLFISSYGSDAELGKLDKKSKEYAERVDYLDRAYQALANSYILFFNYRAAAETYEKIAGIDRFAEQKRKDAARNALVLYSNMGDREKMQAARNRYLSFKPSAEDKADADYLIAMSELRGWDPNGADTDATRAARGKAMAAMSAYYMQYKNSREAAKFTTMAAYYVAKAKVQSGQSADEWWKNTIAEFNKFKSVDPKTATGNSPQGNMAAEADFTMVDADIKKNFDYDTGHHRYKGTAVDVIKKYTADAKDAEKYHAKLKHIADPATYGSIDYVAAAIARQGSLYDSLRTGLFNTREPALQLFTTEEEKTLKKLEESGNEDLMDKAAEFRDKRVQLWRGKRDSELASADQIAVQRYTQAVTVARKYNVRSSAVNRALQRLAFFSDLLGDDKMRAYSANVEGFSYQDGMWQKTRPGMVVEPETQVLPPPLPVMPQ